MEIISSSVTLVWSLVILLVLTWMYLTYLKRSKDSRNRRFPPGPSFALPVLGNLLQLGRSPHLTFQKWRKIYGPVFSWKMATVNVVVISHAKLLKEFFSKDAAAGRVQHPIVGVFSGRLGIINSEGRNWAEQRAFAVKTLYTLTKGGILEDIVLREGALLVKYFEQRVDDRVKINDVFIPALLNTIWTLVSGESHDWVESPHLAHLKTPTDFVEAANNTVQTGLMFAPWLRHVFPGITGFNRLVKAAADLKLMSEEVIERQLANGSLRAQDFIGEYLSHMEGVSDPLSSFYKDIGRKNLPIVVGEIFGAGTETTATVLEFCMLYLSSHLNVQIKIQQELDTVLGSRLPSLSDKDKLPFMEAFILETLRRSSMVPFGLPHTTLEDIEFHDYFLPKGSVVFSDLYGIQMDVDEWTDPHLFRPERFLNEDKSGVIRHEALNPFMVGKRMCLGDGIARGTLFLVVACLMQRFTVESCVQNVNLDDLQAGLSLKPKPFHVVFKLRT